MNKLVMNYLVTEGYKDAADNFREEANETLPNNLSDIDAHTCLEV